MSSLQLAVKRFSPKPRIKVPARVQDLNRDQTVQSRNFKSWSLETVSVNLNVVKKNPEIHDDDDDEADVGPVMSHVFQIFYLW